MNVVTTMGLSLDLRDSNGKMSNFAINAAGAVTGVRDFFYNPDDIPQGYIRGTKRRADFLENQVPKRTRKMPRNNLFTKVRRYNARRTALSRRAGSRSTRYVSTARAPYRKRSYRKKTGAKKTNSSITINQHQLMGGTVTQTSLPGQVATTADKLYGEWFCDYIDSATSTLVPIAHFGGLTNLVYGRLRVPVSKIIASGGMASQFSKLKVNKIFITWNFPDQAADTGNADYPLVMYVNHGDKWKTDIDGAGETVAWSSGEGLLERPGWKRYNLKRMNKFTLSWTPTVCKVREFNAQNIDVDQRKMVNHGFVDLDAAGTSTVDLFGPTIAFSFPKKTTYAAGDYDDFFTAGNAAECDFMTKGTIKVGANVTYKALDNDAYLMTL